MQTLKMLFRKITQPANLMWNVSLAYTLIPILITLGNPQFFFVLVATLVFILAYLLMIYTDKPLIEWVGWTYMIVYIIALTYFSIGMSMFIFYQTNLLTFRYQENYRSIKWLTVYLEMLILTIYAIFSNLLSDLFIIGPVFLFAFGLHFTMKRILEHERLKEKVLAQNESINTLLAENERNRISRDLHDTLGHVFSMLTIKSDLALALLDKGKIQEAKGEIVSLQALTKEITQNVRRIIQDLQQQTINEEITIVEQMLSLAGIEAKIEGKNIANKMTSQQQHIMAMILRELVTNVLKHSQANQCHIKFRQEDGSIIFEVSDNGIGMQEVTGEELHTVKQRLTILQATLTYLSYQPLHIQIIIPTKKDSE